MKKTAIASSAKPKKATAKIAAMKSKIHKTVVQIPFLGGIVWLETAQW